MGQAKQQIKSTESVPPPKCAVTESATGTLVTFAIDPQTWARLSRKMGPQDPATFLWENILHRAIEGAAY